MELTVADVDRVHTRRAALQQTVGETPGGRAKIGGDLPCGIVTEAVQGASKLQASAGHKGMIGSSDRKLDTRGQLHARLVDTLVASKHATRENQRLSAGPTLCESLLDQARVGAFALQFSTAKNR